MFHAPQVAIASNVLAPVTTGNEILRVNCFSVVFQIALFEKINLFWTARFVIEIMETQKEKVEQVYPWQKKLSKEKSVWLSSFNTVGGGGEGFRF